MRYLSLLLISIGCSHLFADSFLSKLSHKYTRPITILYISKEPKWLTTREDDVIVYWTPNKEFYRKQGLAKPENCIFLGANITNTKMTYLALVSHFDIAIIDVEQESEIPLFDYHFADHTFYQTTRLIYEHTPKTQIYQTRQGIRRISGCYQIESDFYKKRLVSKSEYNLWVPGFSLRDFFIFEGVYPSENTILKQIYELFIPGVSTDYKPRNMVLQGTKLKIIDYTPKYKSHSKSEDFYLAKTIEKINRYKTLAKLIF